MNLTDDRDLGNNLIWLWLQLLNHPLYYYGAIHLMVVK